MDKTTTTKRIAASDLDSYRYFRSNEWNTFEELRASLLRLKPAGRPAQLGTAFHAALERLATGDNVDWDAEPIALAPYLEITLPMAGVQHEVPTKRTIEVCGTEYLLSGRLDGYDGLLVGYEYKTTGSALGQAVERFMDSYQWRVYLYCLPEMRRIQYHVFKVKSWKTERPVIDSYIAAPEVYRYTTLEDDVRGQVGEFASFVDDHIPEYWRRYDLSDAEKKELLQS